MRILTPFLDTLRGPFWTIIGPTWAPKRTPKQPRTGPVYSGRRTGLRSNAGMLALGSSRSPPGPPRARLGPLLGPSRGPLRPFLAPFGPFSGRLWLVLGSILAISDLLLCKGAKVKRANVHITGPFVMMTSRRPIDTYNIDQPHGIPEPNKRWDGGEMVHRKRKNPPAGGLALFNRFAHSAGPYCSIAAACLRARDCIWGASWGRLGASWGPPEGLWGASWGFLGAS